ncbi:MAG: TadE/TadG family type IV pilus assembly protein [Acidobacteriota bacterium]
MNRYTQKSRQRGASVIEGALVLLLLFTLIFTIIEAGRMFNVQNVVTNAAREGARYAVVPNTGTSTLQPDADIRTRVTAFMQSSSIEGATITINDGAGIATPVVINGIEFTKVQVSVPYSFLSLPLLGNISLNIRGTSLMRNETSP